MLFLNLDPDLDPNRSNPDVHYRLYLTRDGALSVICVQDFDYPDYDDARFVTYRAWDTEAAAVAAIETLWQEYATLQRALQLHLEKRYARMTVPDASFEQLVALAAEGERLKGVPEPASFLVHRVCPACGADVRVTTATVAAECVEDCGWAGWLGDLDDWEDD
jgi:hypothetical protein